MSDDVRLMLGENLLGHAEQVLGPGLVRPLLAIGELAAEQRLESFLIGGAVRDLLLGERSDDIDVMVTGDAIAFTKLLSARWPTLLADLSEPTKPVSFPKYGTAKLSFESELAPGVSSLDFASARKEVYPGSGVPPLVSFPASVEEDLGRRDFSVNSMALSLSPRRPFALFDPFNGREAIARRELSVLHEGSFVDDPARILRGLRFASRFGFSFAPSTERLLSAALSEGMLQRLPPFRLFDEMRKAAAERDPGPTFGLFAERQILSQFHPEALKPQMSVDRAALAGAEAWMFWMVSLFPTLESAAFEAVLKEFGVQPVLRKRLAQVRHEVFSTRGR